MVSNVKGPTSTVVTPLDQRSIKVGKADTADSVAAAAGQQADVVTLTDLAARLQTLTQAVADLPAVDREKVASFRAAIEDGSYAIDSRAVAEKLTQFEALLSGSPKTTQG